ncbi:ATPase, vacuolar ER assembly factor, Vma12 [Cordyceps javanica]|uniref:ATPase, vacuolar ER assembly factor, Vma12 n=1 Tax=Cordyceps javanica TaxID=43265 RepID=A0A545VSX8_9HYPO|nr:ATPase, vacuolar ER assembly factor, Vma12 [Cordyceps javanica]TQW04821.1 ATPase, vacuolar ER assembly factor, Vma12 [Cordyceps javanica]
MLAMVNSSPEYPGIRPLSRKRDKPLRTYGRQPTATPEPRSEPPTKRARTTYAVDGDKNIKPLGITVPEDCVPVVIPVFRARERSTAEEDGENQTTSKPEPNVPAKRSILNYFKPVMTHLTPIKPPTMNRLPDAEPAEIKKAEPVSRRRQLRIQSRPSIKPDDEVDNASGNIHKCEGDGARNAIEGEPRQKRKRRLGGGCSDGSESKRLRRKSWPTEVQTTLNISNQAAFSECKICDTVWNPLYPDDVKCHTKRHAAHLRTKKKTRDDF